MELHGLEMKREWFERQSSNSGREDLLRAALNSDLEFDGLGSELLRAVLSGNAVSGTFVVQCLDAIDLSVPLAQKLPSAAHVDDAQLHGQVSRGRTRRLSKLLLTDGVRRVVALEKAQCPALDNLLYGGKLIVHADRIKYRNGLLLLGWDSVELLGGFVAAVQVERNREAALRQPMSAQAQLAAEAPSALLAAPPSLAAEARTTTSSAATLVSRATTAETHPPSAPRHEENTAYLTGNRLAHFLNPHVSGVVVHATIVAVVGPIEYHSGKYFLPVALDDGFDVVTVDLGNDFIQNELKLSASEFARLAEESQSDWTDTLDTVALAINEMPPSLFSVEKNSQSAASPDHGIPTVVRIQTFEFRWITRIIEQLEFECRSQQP